MGRLQTRYHRQGKNEWQNDCGAVSMPKDSTRTRIITVDTAKHFIIPIETLFKDLPFSVHKAA